MKKIIGIRREDKNEWERRVPLIPRDIRWLKETSSISAVVQPSPVRIFSDDEFRQAGAEISEDLGQAEVIFAVKEIPETLFLKNKTYVFFSHTVKGQPHNMPMLRKMVELECNLIDYERVINEKNQRLIFFGRYAGLAGMIDTLHGLGQKLKLRGLATPFEKIKQAYQYDSLELAKREIAAIGDEIGERGFPAGLCPLVVGFAGYGHVSQGAQEIFDLLPHKTISPQTLLEMAENFSNDNLNLYKVIFKEEDLVKPRSDRFDLQDYYDHPENYQPRFEEYLPHLSVLINGIFWTERYPRLVTRRYLKESAVLDPNPRLLVIGDISCDIDGSVEITHKATKPDQAFFTYSPIADDFQDGIQRLGVTVMAVDNLPCEFSGEASQEFSVVLRNFVDAIVKADYRQPTEKLGLPFPIQKALILHHGRFTPEYQYMQEFIRKEAK